MAQYKVTDSELSGIASAIRLKGGTSDPLVFPSGFVSAISAIETQGTYVSKIITENGEYDPASDNADAFSHVTVSVPTGSVPVLVSKSISENGTYNPADDNADAYSQVVVNVSGGGGSDDNFKKMIGAMSGRIFDSEITSISAWAFSNNIISEIEMTALVSMNNSTFYRCSRLTYASFQNLSTVGYAAFSECSYLTSVTLPKCKSVDYAGFFGCIRLPSIELPLCGYIQSYAFYNCRLLSKIALPECSEIGSYAFQHCYSLSSANVPKVETIGGSAFISCTNLEMASFPKLKSIPYTSLFNSCTHLISLYLLGEYVSCNANISKAFGSTPIGGYSASAGQYGSIFVPSSLYDTYISAIGWSMLSDRIASYTE